MASIYEKRLDLLKLEMKKISLDSLILFRGDYHLGEEILPSFEYLEWLVGFTGSTAILVVKATGKTTIFLDSRYFEFACKVMDKKLLDIVPLSEFFGKNEYKWFKQNLDGLQVGCDSNCVAVTSFEKLEIAAKHSNFKLRAVDQDLVAKIWQDKPACGGTKVFFHQFGENCQPFEQKIREARDKLNKVKVKSTVFVQSDDVAWLLNIRASDFPDLFTPSAYLYLDTAEQGAIYYITRQSKVNQEILPIEVRNYCTVISFDDFQKNVESGTLAPSTIGFDKNNTPQFLVNLFNKASSQIVFIKNPLLSLRAEKNSKEVQGMRDAHLLDGVAMVKFAIWLDNQFSSKNPNLLEYDIVEKIDQIRKNTAKKLSSELNNKYFGGSFSTIAGASGNASYPHYSPDSKNSSKLIPGEALLLDTGGQYEKGTTDITRVFALGANSKFIEKLRYYYTIVLKAHISLAKQRFPKNTSGSQLDAVARYKLWNDGLDFDHGTGHGIGLFSVVHEQGVSISPMASGGLLPGMTVTNEPGHYIAGELGVRIENVMAVVEDAKTSDNVDDMLAFEYLTMMPMDRRLIDLKLMSDDEVVWLNKYHQKVFSNLSCYLSEEEKNWLLQATAAFPLKSS